MFILFAVVVANTNVVDVQDDDDDTDDDDTTWCV